MIHAAYGKTVVMFGHDLVQIRGLKINGTACIGLAYNEGDNSQLREPEIVLSFGTRKSIETMIAALEVMKACLYDDPNEIELEYCE